jgi:molecular chaperone HscB
MSTSYLDKSFFELFDFDVAFGIDIEQLNLRYRALQQRFHPDKFANSDQRDQRIALQVSAHINEAYTALSSPLKRAQYLLSLSGVDASGEHTTTHDTGFLMQQIMLREQLEEVSDAADPEAAIDALRASVDQTSQAMIASFEECYANAQFSEAVVVVARLQFLFKLILEIDAVEERLLDY